MAGVDNILLGAYWGAAYCPQFSEGSVHFCGHVSSSAYCQSLIIQPAGVTFPQLSVSCTFAHMKRPKINK